MPAFPVEDLYALLDVSADAPFSVLKKAYYRQAKRCHPDLHRGTRDKEQQFQQLVHAFDVLSDPIQRRAYDKWREQASKIAQAPVRYHAQRSYWIMDSAADDILEELIVGNYVPAGSSLQTLLTDLESTDRFICFREGKTAYYTGHYAAAQVAFRRCLGNCSVNILYHFYFAECAMRLKQYRKARKHYRRCLAIGQDRVPVQRLERVHRRLNALRRKRHGFLAKAADLFFGPPPAPKEAGTDAVLAEASRAMGKMLQQAEEQDRRQQEDPDRLLNE